MGLYCGFEISILSTLALFSTTYVKKSKLAEIKWQLYIMITLYIDMCVKDLLRLVQERLHKNVVKVSRKGS